MPATPFHLGPGLLVGLLLFGIIHLPTFLIASVILDLEPLSVLLFCPGCNHHGFFHSFLGGSIVAVVLGAVMLIADGKVRKIISCFKLEQKATKKNVFLAAFSGIYLHILLDSMLYSDMKPFFPLAINPFYIGTIPAFIAVYALCAVLFVAGIAFYAFKFLKNKGLK